MSSEKNKQKIHPTAQVEPGAEIGPGVQIGPYTVIGPEVKIGPGTVIKPHTVIDGATVIGDENVIGPMVSLGAPPQDIKYRGERTSLVIGDRNIIREHVTVHVGTADGRGETTIGSGCMLMVGVHIPHDCIIGDGVIIANATHLGGHVEVHDHAVIGALVGIHQNARVGAVAMVAAKAGVPMDVPPYTIAGGDRASLFGLNRVGMERVGISKETRADLRKTYRILFQSALKLNEAIEKVRAEVNSSKEVEIMLEFLETSKRGILR